MIRKKLQGNFTIEAAVIVPVFLMIFALTVTMLFYYHDKNVVAAIAHETLVIGCGKEEITEKEMEQYLQSRARNKLLLFTGIRSKAEIRDDKITILCTARKKGMSLRIQLNTERKDPEEFIWKLRRIQGIAKAE